MNAIKHGLRIEALALTDIEGTRLRERLEWWIDYYRPETPGECQLIDIAVTAEVQIERCQRFLAAEVGENVRKAGLDWDRAREDEVAAHRKLLDQEPEDAVRLLGRTGLGCRWLIGRWERLGALLGRDGDEGWQGRDCDEAVRLQGHKPDADTAEAAGTRRRHEEVCPEQARFQCGDGPRYGDVRDVLLSPSWGKPLPDRKDPGVAAVRERALGWLRALIAEHLGPLRAREEELRQVHDEPSRAAAGERALLPVGATGSLWLRYQRTHEMTFHRAYKALLSGRERAAETGVPPGAPSEANEAEDDNINSVDRSTYVTGPASESGAAAPSRLRRAGRSRRKSRRGRSCSQRPWGREREENRRKMPQPSTKS